MNEADRRSGTAAPPNYLVFGGGGIFGFYILGALIAFVKIHPDIYSHVKGVIGTSIGAVVALIASMKTSSDDMIAIVNELEYDMFQLHTNPMTLFTSYGLCDHVLLNNIATVIINKVGLHEDITFEMLYKINGCHYVCCACDVNTRQLVNFDYLSHPKKNKKQHMIATSHRLST